MELTGRQECRHRNYVVILSNSFINTSLHHPKNSVHQTCDPGDGLTYFVNQTDQQFLCILHSTPVKSYHPLLAIDLAIMPQFPAVQFPLSKTMYGMLTQSSLQSTHLYLMQFCRIMCQCSVFPQHPRRLTHQLFSHKVVQQMSSSSSCRL